MTNPKATFIRTSFGFLMIAAFAVILPTIIPTLDFIKIPGLIGGLVGSMISAVFSLTVPKG